MTYRAEIDGLRAFAVVPVLVYHVQSSVLPGGAAGVDIFFVISGFLITRILLQDLASGQWSIRRFYARRARRIFPALFAMLGVSLVMAWCLDLPFQLADHARATLSAMVFVSNLHFLESLDYFTDQIETNPLIHTWSLGVEEQYYLFIPLFLLAVWRIAAHGRERRAVAWGLAILGLCSFCLALWGAENKPQANFFFTPSRIWELLAGAAGGLYASGPMRVPARIAGWGVNVGAAGLLASYVLITPAMPFPSAWTVLPVMSAVLLMVFATGRCLVGGVLTARPVVWTGVISYSLYLWHQPMLAFWRFAYPLAGPVTLWAVAVGAVPVAWLSWRWIEQPFRNGAVGPAARFRAMAGTAGVIVAAAAAIAVFKPDTPAFLRLDAGMQQIVRFVGARIDQTALYRKGTCFVDGPFPDPAACRAAAPGPVLLWGDSHAAGLAVGLRDVVPDFGAYGVMRCPIFVADAAGMTTACRTAHEQVLAQIGLAQPRMVILLRDWTNHEDEIATLPQTIADIRRQSPGTRVMLLGGLPKWPVALPEMLLARGGAVANGAVLEGDLARLRHLDRTLQDVAQASDAGFVSLIDLLCAGAVCRAVVAAPDGLLEPTSFDRAHLGAAGARYLTGLLVPALGLVSH